MTGVALISILSLISAGEVYILEIGPRSGGNLITDAINERREISTSQNTQYSRLRLVKL
jgi:hypothetical protein